MIKSGIYSIINIINNKMYIGSTINFSNRWSRHRYNLNNTNHSNSHLRSSWLKYGPENFIFSVIEYVEDITQLELREQFWMDKFKPEYNKRLIAENNLGIKLTDEQRQNRVKSGKYKNRVITEIWRKRMSEAGFKRDKMSEETKKKMSQTRSGKVPLNLSDLHIKSRKKVYQYSRDGEFINEFVSIKEATEITKIRNIWMCCNGRRNHAGGFVWTHEKKS